MPRSSRLSGSQSGLGLQAQTTVGEQAASTPRSMAELVQTLLDAEFAGGAHLTFTDGTFERFGGTHWTILSNEELGQIVLPYILEDTSGHQRVITQLRNLTGILRHRSAIPIRDSEVELPPIINTAKCELWFDAAGRIEAKPHDPKSHLHYCLPVEYNPDACCPLYDRALAEIFSASTDRAALVALWHEITGFLIQPLRRRALVVVALGRGQDGKSALAETLVRVLGRSRVMSMPVEDLSSSRFVVASLAAKALFLDPDMAAGTVLPDGLLKQMAEGTTMTGDRKFREPITYRSSAVPLLLTNHVPRIVDGERGFRRRLVVLPFDRQFGDCEVDLNLFPEIHANEMSGVLNRMLEGLHRVITRGWKFDLPGEVEKVTDAWWDVACHKTNSRFRALGAGVTLNNYYRSDSFAPLRTAGAEARLSKSKSFRKDNNHDAALKLKINVPNDVAEITVDIDCNRGVKICLG